MNVFYKTKIHEYHEGGVLKKCWTCDKKLNRTFKHRHTKKEDAEDCIKKNFEYYNNQNKNTWNNDNLKKLFDLWEQGNISKKDLGKVFGISGNRIDQILKTYNRQGRIKKRNETV